jgi:hypothetical protein
MRKPLPIRRIDPHRFVELTSGVSDLTPVQGQQPETKIKAKPRLDSISYPLGVLILFLCLLSLQLGFFAASRSYHSEIIWAGMLSLVGFIFNHLARHFRWSRSTANLLNIASWLFIGCSTFMLWFWYSASN